MSKIKYVTPANAAAVDELIAKAVNSVSKARDLVQVACVAILIHAAKHNDYSKANDIVNALNGTVNSAAIVEWFVKFGGLIVAEDGSGFGSWQGPKYIAENLEAGKENMWYEMRRPNPFAGYNAEAELQRYIKRFTQMHKKIVDLDDEDKAKVSFAISAGTIDALFKLVKMETVIAPDAEEQLTEGDVEKAAA